MYKKRKITNDLVNHPSHYKTGGIKTTNLIKSEELSYHISKVVNYVAPAGHKDDLLQDLQRARWYLDREIQRLSKAKDE